MPRQDLIQPRRGTAAAWTSANPVLAVGEPGLETDTKRRKTGDGTTAWAVLPYDLDDAGARATSALLRAETSPIGRLADESRALRIVRALAARFGYTKYRPVTVTNPGASKTKAWPAKISLTSANFVFTDAQPDGRDVQVRLSDGVTVLPHWLASWNAVAQTAEVWVLMPKMAANVATTVRLYYGNADAVSTADITKVFPVGADFKQDRADTWSYPALSAPLEILPKDQAYESTSATHTLDFLDFGPTGRVAPDGNTYRFWGYSGHYGADGIGLAFTNNLAGQWTKYAGNPLLDSTAHVRWATVQIADDGTGHMVVQNTASNDLRRYTSTDFITWTFAEVLAADAGFDMGNGFFFRDPASNDYILWLWRRPTGGSGAGTERVCYRRAATIPALTQARTIEESSSPLVWAAPAMTYFDGLYWLHTEDYDTGSQLWRTIVRSSATPTGPFVACSNSILLPADEPCSRPFVVDGVLYNFSAQRFSQSNTNWHFCVRTGVPRRGKQTVPAVQSFPVHSYAAQGVVTLVEDTSIGAGALAPRAGRLTCDINGSDLSKSIFAAGTVPADHVLTARFRRFGSGGVYLGTRGSLNGARYRADIAGANAHIDTVGSWANGGVHLATGSTTAISNTANWYLAEFVALGNSLDLRINGASVVSVTDSTYAAGGYAEIGGGKLSDVAYDYVYARPYDGADLTTVVGAEASGEDAGTSRPAPVTLVPLGRSPGSNVAWSLANRGIFAQVAVSASGRPYRYYRVQIGVSSGNVQVGLVRLSGAGLLSYTRVMDSGIIACPAAASSVIVDLGSTVLPPGDYALVEWCDNTTATFAVVSGTAQAKLATCAQVDGLTTGIPASGTLAAWGTTILPDVALGADI